ncbi:MAG: MBOAT family protein [Clostridia bacterium]|nr:MBOAT family protein [Clostridia bacterium]
MVFSSMLFLWIFLPLVLAVYYIGSKGIGAICAAHSSGRASSSRFRKVSNGILIFFSLLFYAWGEPVYIFLMLFSVAVNFAGGILLEQNPGKKKEILVGTILINLALLGYFKYFSTAAEAIRGIFFPDGTGTALFQGALPIGISFYTFQALSYVIDVYRGEVKAQHNFWDMLLYISFFPQLIAGPIVKYKDIAAQISGRKETIEKFAAGIMRFCWGLGKKVLFANSFAKVVDDIFKYGPYAVSRKALWLGAALYMLQIYYDFSGYSDMAIGLGKMFGFEFQENFNYPYVSGSVQEFWRRWHISLSSWFRDYVYIPLGGNRKGTACTYRNLLIVFFLTGMWHGAGMAFILWGLYHGLFLILERAWLGKKLEKLPKAVGWSYTMAVVFFGWILFRAEDLSLFFSYVRNLFVSHGGIILLSAYLDRKMIFLIITGILFAGIIQRFYKVLRNHFSGKIPADGVVTIPRIIASVVIFWLCVTALVNNSYNPFIYFRF